MATKAEVIDDIRTHLGFNSGLSESKIVRQIVRAQEMLEEFPELPDFLRVYNHEIAVAEGVNFTALPTDFIRFMDEPAVFIFDATENALRPYQPLFRRLEIPPNYDYLGTGYYNEVTSVNVNTYPEFYVLRRDQTTAPFNNFIDFYKFPTTRAMTLRVNYFKKADSLSGAIDQNHWTLFAPELLVGMAGAAIASGLRDRDAIAVFNEIRSTALKQVYEHGFANDQGGIRPVMGGEN